MDGNTPQFNLTARVFKPRLRVSSPLNPEARAFVAPWNPEVPEFIPKGNVSSSCPDLNPNADSFVPKQKGFNCREVLPEQDEALLLHVSSKKYTSVGGAEEEDDDDSLKMSLSRNKELRMFEALESLTKHESFDSSASFVRHFVSSDLDLNNTHQSKPEEDEAVLSYVSSKKCTSGGEQEEEEDDSIIVFEEDGVDTHSETGDESHNQRSDDKGGADSHSRSVHSLSDEEEEGDGYDGKEDGESFRTLTYGKGFTSVNVFGYNRKKHEEYLRTLEQSEKKDDKSSVHVAGDKDKRPLSPQSASRGADYEMQQLLLVLQDKHITEYLLLSEMKRTVELQESQLKREQEAFAKVRNAEQLKMQVENERVENQLKNLQSLITDYHKMKSSKDEGETKIKVLTEQLQDTKLEMSKRISRWEDQQKRLEERVKTLEKENEELKKLKPTIPAKRAALKRPPMLPKPPSKNLKRIQFADDVVVGTENRPGTSRTSAGASKSSAINGNVAKACDSAIQKVPCPEEYANGLEDDSRGSGWQFWRRRFAGTKDVNEGLQSGNHFSFYV